MIQKQGKHHEHKTLYKIMETDAQWDIELDALLDRNRLQFKKDFERDIKGIYVVQQMIEYISRLTDLERYFLGV